MKKEMKKIYLKKVNSTMIEQLVNYENYKINALSQMIEFVNNSSIPNKEEVIEDYKQTLQNDKEEPKIVLGGEFDQYVLTYDEFDNTITFENELDDTFSFGVEFQNMDITDYYTYVDIAVALNDHIEVYFKDEITEDCGEYWEI